MLLNLQYAPYPSYTHLYAATWARDINVTGDLEGEANTRDDIIANSVEGETVARQLNAVANIQ